MNFEKTSCVSQFLASLIASGALFAVGCSPRRFNAGAENSVKAKGGTSQSEFEICGKKIRVKKESDLRVLRLNPNSATLLASKRKEQSLQRYAEIDLSKIEDNEAIEKFQQCYVVTDVKGVLVASRSRAMNADEKFASFEMVACGKPTKDGVAYKVDQSADSPLKGDYWVIAREDSFAAELQKIAGSAGEACFIGKPIKFETGIAIVFDEQSYFVASVGKKP